MVGFTMYYCALCPSEFNSKRAYNRHLANHSEPASPRFPCPTCSFMFSDSHALENHKLQTRHGEPAFHCDNCNKDFQTEGKYNDHRKFPSPCSDAFNKSPPRADRNTPVDTAVREGQVARMASPTHQGRRSGYVDLDAPTSPSFSNVPYYDRSTTPSNVEGIFCHDCNKAFESEALFTRHGLSCLVRKQSTSQQNISESREMKGDARRTHTTLASHQYVPEVAQEVKDGAEIMRATSARSLAEAARPIQPQLQENMHARLHDAPPVTQPSDKVLQPRNNALPTQQNTASTEDVSSFPAPQLTVPRPGAWPVKPKRSTAAAVSSRAAPPPPSKPAPPAAMPSHPAPLPNVTDKLVCGVSGCQATYRSQPGLDQHKRDIHSIGGQALDIRGRDSWMLGQRERERLKSLGLLRLTGPAAQQARRAAANSSRGGPPAATGRHPPRAPLAAQQTLRGPISTPPAATGRQPPRAPAAAQQTLRAPISTPPAAVGRQPPRAPAAAQQALHAPMSTAMASASAPSVGGGPADVEQANMIYGKIMRLLIQENISIRHEGKIVYNGEPWVRVPVAKQQALVGMFEKQIHLRPMLQDTEYVPWPKAFWEEYKAEYPVDDFEFLPESLDENPGLDVVALCCSKIVLENYVEEVVKIAAVDVLTGRPLMSYLVCTDPTAKVTDWRTGVTGLSGFRDFEAARSQKYKVLRGWKAARAAVGKFAKKKTILVGYNLRSDLDALRIIHGRSVDVIKCVEKAAGGPLSKQQLRLDSLCRDYPQVRLSSHPVFGRDALQDAFAIRQLALWFIKEDAQLVKIAKRKSLEYQSVNGLLSST